MPLQPIFPEPITVANNVADARHKLRVAFVRRTVLFHSLSVFFVTAWAAFSPFTLPLGFSSAMFALGLIALSVQRRILNGGAKDNVLSVLVLLPTLYFLAHMVRFLHFTGWPVLIFVPVTIGIALYAVFCGNDFSYAGQFVLCSVATIICLLLFWITGFYREWQVFVGAIGSAGYLFYFVYDLSMLVKRRRFGEELASVADLYRDLLNFLTYSVRVYFHWRKFRFVRFFGSN